MAGGSNRAARGGRARGRGMARGSGSTLSSTSQGTAYGKGGTAELELAKQVSQDDYNSQQMYQTWGSQLQGTASFKLDGSLIIAFVWQGQLYTCTRRRMDSEQVRQALTLLLAISYAAMPHRVLSRWTPNSDATVTGPRGTPEDQSKSSVGNMTLVLAL